MEVERRMKDNFLYGRKPKVVEQEWDLRVGLGTGLQRRSTLGAFSLTFAAALPGVI